MQVSGQNLRLMLDTNIWVDYFLRNPDTGSDCALLLERALEHDVDLLVSPTTLKDVFYLIPRRFRRQDLAVGKPETSYEAAAWGCLEFMLEIATPSPLSLMECSLARNLRSRFNDFEDNLVLASAETARVDYIVTLDKLLLDRFPEACVRPNRAIELMD